MECQGRQNPVIMELHNELWNLMMNVCNELLLHATKQNKNKTLSRKNIPPRLSIFLHLYSTRIY